MANWLDLNKLQEWPDIVFLGYQYDEIADTDIEAALVDVATLTQVNPSIDWEDDRWLSRTRAVPQHLKHAYRIAALVKTFREGGRMHDAIELDTYCMVQCRSSIPNGHHRIRALQFLKHDCAPFSLSGSVELLERLVAVAGVESPANASAWCVDSLISPADDDIRLPKPPVRSRKSNNR